MAFPDLIVPLTLLADQTPADDDVVAGPLGALVFVLLIGAVVFLGFSLRKQLRKAQAAKDAGVYDEPDESSDDQTQSGTP